MNTRELDKRASLCKKLREQILKEGTQDLSLIHISEPTRPKR